MAKRTLLTTVFNSQPVISYVDDDPIIHTAEHPYCDDPECPCNENLECEYGAMAEHDETGTHAPNCRCYWCSAEEGY